MRAASIAMVMLASASAHADTVELGVLGGVRSKQLVGEVFGDAVISGSIAGMVELHLSETWSVVLEPGVRWSGNESFSLLYANLPLLGRARFALRDDLSIRAAAGLELGLLASAHTVHTGVSSDGFRDRLRPTETRVVAGLGLEYGRGSHLFAELRVNRGLHTIDGGEMPFFVATREVGLWVGAARFAPALPHAGIADDASSPLRAPPFATMDRGDGVTRLGLETSLSTTSYASDPTSRTTVSRTELYGQYVHASGLGAYAKVPLSYTNYRYDQDDPGDTALRLHNLELGALLAKRLAPSLGIVLQAGAALPTLAASDVQHDGSFFDGSRTADHPLAAAAHLTALRLSVSPVFRAEGIFARLDLGLDAVVASDAAPAPATTSVRGALGAGYAGERLSVTAEYVTYRTGDGSLDALSLSGRFALGDYQPYAALTVPVDDRFVDVALTLGAQRRL